MPPTLPSPRTLVPAALFLGAVVLVLAMPPAGAAVLGVLGGILFFLLFPCDWRVVAFCLAGAMYINVIRLFVDSLYPLLFFDFLLCLAVFLSFLNHAARRRTASAESPLVLSPPVILALLFLVICVVQLWNPNVPDVQFALKGFRKTCLTIVGFFAAVWMFHGREELDKTWRIVGLAALPVCLYGIKQGLFLSAFDYRMLDTVAADVVTMKLARGYRAFSIFPGPFHLGMFSCIVALIALYLLKGRNRLFWGAVYLTAFLAMAFAQTRTNLLAFFAVSLLFLLLTTSHPGKWIRNLLLLGLLALPLVYAGYALRIERFERLVVSLTRIGEDTRLLKRFDLYPHIIQAILEHPFRGYGMGSGGDTLEAEIGVVHFTSHNLALKILLETGIAGTLVFFGLVAWCAGPFAGLWKRRRESPETYRLATLAVSILGVILVNGIVGSAIEAYPCNLLFWFALGSLLTLSEEQKRSALAPPEDIEPVGSKPGNP